MPVLHGSNWHMKQKGAKSWKVDAPEQCVLLKFWQRAHCFKLDQKQKTREGNQEVFHANQHAGDMLSRSRWNKLGNSFATSSDKGRLNQLAGPAKCTQI